MTQLVKSGALPLRWLYSRFLPFLRKQQQQQRQNDHWQLRVDVVVVFACNTGEKK